MEECSLRGLQLASSAPWAQAGGVCSSLLLSPTASDPLSRFPSFPLPFPFPCPPLVFSPDRFIASLIMSLKHLLLALPLLASTASAGTGSFDISESPIMYNLKTST